MERKGSMTVTTGTPETRTEHTMLRTVMGLMASMGMPTAVAIIGIAAFGWDAIHWLMAIIWGIGATSRREHQSPQAFWR